MLINYFKIAYRNLIHQKALSFINIIGLSIGLACFSLFLLYALHEFSFDSFHKDADQIYRMYRWTADLDGEGEEGDPHLPMPLGLAFASEFPDVENVVRWKEAWEESFVKANGKVHRGEMINVDPSVFEVFNFPLLYGDPQSALNDPTNVILTEIIAQKYFNESNPIGKTIEIQIQDTFELFTVSAVAKNVPANSSKQFQIMGSFAQFESTAFGKRRINNWNSSFLSVFVKLREGSGLQHNSEALLNFRRAHYPDQERELRENGIWTGEGAPATYKLQPLTKMHTESSVSGGDIPPIDPKNIWILMAIAVGILLIAIINFTTLSIGRSAKRAKEVGIRKVIGSNRSQLAFQFLLESVLLSCLSVVIGLGLGRILLPFFNQLANREMTFSFSQYPNFLWLLIGVTLLTGILAGSYPALLLSKFKPVEVFKNKLKLGGSNIFTNTLVTSQFVISSGLLIAALIILNQLNFLKAKNPGFNKQNVIVVDAEGTDSKQVYRLYKDKLSKERSILGVASSDIGIGAESGWSRSGFEYKGEVKQIYEYYIDDEYLEVMGMELLSGREFEPDRQDGPNRNVIINESMATNFGWELETAVGQELSGYFGENIDEINPKVIGVVKDFNFRSLRENVKPQMFHQYEDYDPYKFFIRIESGDPSKSLAILENNWNQIVPQFPFKYSFLDSDIELFYRAEARFSNIMIWAVGISIFLACLGLLGLASLAASNRKKEVGIRKILGANVATIIGILSKDFLKMVITAFIISGPIVYLLMKKWLANFAYQSSMHWWIFLLAGALTIIVSFLTVSLKSYMAAVANPVDSLRSE